jgi:hypothetical protein
VPGLGEKEWRAHAELIGRVTLSWNHNVHQLLRVFTHLTGLDSPLADEIFFSHQSDKGQRLLIKRVTSCVDIPDSAQKALKKLLKRLEDVSTGRNLAAHIIFGISLFDRNSGGWAPTVVPALMPPQDKRLEDDFKAQFEQVDRDLQAIYKELEEWLITTPFPERPWGLPAILGAAPVYVEPDCAGSDTPTDWGLIAAGASSETTEEPCGF